ncbi:MAG: RNA-dependent RNA polymerase [Wufeng bat tupavirus 2]|nr:MAG: RNA-dependent RNA polymerase [Wufeng bat tupavirus 2]
MDWTTAEDLVDNQDTWLLSDDDNWLDPQKLPPLGSVKNADYNLNSPLLSDEIDAFFSFLNGRIFPQIFFNQAWFLTREVIDRNHIRLQPTTAVAHTWAANFFLRSPVVETNANSLLNLTEHQARVTHKVPELFFKSLQSPGLEFLSRKNDPDLVELLSKFLDFHTLTLVMNHYHDDLSFINQLGTYKRESLDDQYYHVLDLPTVGDVYVTPFCCIVDSSVLLTKNLVLMVKDVLLARFQTILTMFPRHDGKFDQDDVYTLKKVYRLGDYMVAMLGPLAYDHIKLLEPLCNLQLTVLARSHRPLIPEFPSFRLYLEDELVKIYPVNPYMKILHDTIQSISKVDLVIQIFGCFRHWGHPFIDYFEGLSKLHEQVTLRKEIDDTLAQQLASDLAFLVLKSQFKKKKTWFVDKNAVGETHPLYRHIQDDVWPTPKVIEDFGDNWHKLPLTACFDIPDLVDPSLIYSDKSHSIYRNELVRHVRTTPNIRFPTRRVLTTFLETPARDWKQFLLQVDQEGLPYNALCIGLRPKERELKRCGRFFALMSWELREYFVFTEYLIKEHFIPLFKGLTMADDMTGVIKKLLESSNGHGIDTYDQITISNHLDYSKWNNHQRLESNQYVFRVMGQFLGYPNLILRTHEFFQKSLIYFVNRPDLMRVEGETLVNRTDNMVCWNGQSGGLEGLRQKGWSILNLLLILRLGKQRNTEIKILAQGDNQVLNMHYKLPTHRTPDELETCIAEVVRNNNFIMSEVDKWAQRLGLIINRDETMQSADFLIYGKVPIYRGNVTIPESKRWARVNCVTNDQLPTYANVLSTVSSTSLTVSHFSDSFSDPIELYNYIGNLSRILLETFDPILNKPLVLFPDLLPGLSSPEYMISALYLDPSLGGICGMSLTRFLIRNFPDPVTEGLSFWKQLASVCDDFNLKRLFLKFGNPHLSKFKPEDLVKLMEKPESLNIPNSLSAQILIRSEIRTILRRNVKRIKNEIVANAITYGVQAEAHLIQFLLSVRPLFPRFLAEFKAGTYLGLTESLVGLYENSKTIRNKFLSEREREIDFLIQRSELSGIKHLITYSTGFHQASEWSCSATQADRLRRVSWGDTVIGATIPHPLEMLTVGSSLNINLNCCHQRKQDYLTTFVRLDRSLLRTHRGPYLPYLGSKTSESTSLLTPWEKETTIPLIKRAARLRNAINWFVDPTSRLAQSIQNNLRALTGEEPGLYNLGFMRTGSALHRFSSSRQSAGGYAALSPAVISRFLTTTDTLGDLGDQNYDFMFQSLILFCQSTLAGVAKLNFEGVVHHHLQCKGCLRPISEPRLESKIIYHPVSVAHHIRKWIPNDNPLLESRAPLNLEVGDWGRVTDRSKSYHIGRVIGFVFADGVYTGSKLVEESSLFPNSLRNHLHPPEFYSGLLDGLLRGCSVHIIHRRNVSLLKKPRETLTGSLFFSITQLSNNSQFLNLIRSGPLHNYLLTTSHRTPPSYPLSKWDLGSVVRHFLKRSHTQSSFKVDRPSLTTIWIFADIVGVELAGPLILSTKVLKLVMRPQRTKAMSDELRELKDLEISLRSKQVQDLRLLDLTHACLCQSEVRHAAKGICITEHDYPIPDYTFGDETSGCIQSTELKFLSLREVGPLERFPVPRIMCPLISGLRTVQLATGAHYKVRSILRGLSIDFQDFLCGGDGSGGLTSMCLRLNPSSRGIFNSLLMLEGFELRGSRPSQPSAICALGSAKSRCVNLETCWEKPSDLTNQVTWDYFKVEVRTHKLYLNLMIFDMENRDEQSESIERLLEVNTPRLLKRGGTILFKTYVHRLQSESTHSWIENLSRSFHRVLACQTEFTSSFSSEVYLVFQGYGDYVSGTRFLDVTPLYSFLKECFVYSDEKSEWLRGLRVSQRDMEVGIPPELLPDPEIELATSLEIAGVESGKAATLSSLVSRAELDLKARYLVLKIILTDSIFNISSKHQVYPNIPSDSRLLKFTAFLAGLELWWSMKGRNFHLFRLWSRILQNDLYISFRRAEDRSLWEVYVNIGYKAHWTNKRLRLQGQSAAIGASLRCLLRSCLSQDSMKIPRLHTLLSTFNQALTKTLVHSKTNILSYHHDYNEESTLPVSSEILNTSEHMDSSLVE